jgi:hypothetical protein
LPDNDEVKRQKFLTTRIFFLPAEIAPALECAAA